MKRVLITGVNSYVGTNVKNWLMKEPDNYYVETLDVKDPSWIKFDFSKFDVVFHVAAIVHIKNSNEELYYKVNRDLAYDVAKKSRLAKVNQFIFMSSMSVFGIEKGSIKTDTIPHPKTTYGKSKLEAEKLISSIEDKKFIVTILRPPIIYGKGCKGNYAKISSYVHKFPVFPLINNKRSMLYIDNFSEMIKQLIKRNLRGVYHPQNTEYVNIVELVTLIAKAYDKKIHLTRVFNFFIRLINLSVFNKLFNDLYYDKMISIYDFEYRIVNFEQSISCSEAIHEKKN